LPICGMLWPTHVLAQRARRGKEEQSAAFAAFFPCSASCDGNKQM
jgi:hypothetical protein